MTGPPHYYFVRKFQNPDLTMLRDYLIRANAAQIFSLCECVLNIVDGTVPISDIDREILRPYQWRLRALTTGKIPHTQAKRILIQNRSILRIIVNPIIAKYDDQFKEEGEPNELLGRIENQQ
jgi:hypothetical protein